MALSEIDQIKHLVGQHQYFLIVFPPYDRGDALAAALAWKVFLERQGKQVDLVASGFTVPKAFHFLPGAETVKPRLSEVQKFIIKVDVTKAPIETISYDVKDNWLSIYLTPAHGSLSKSELRTAQSLFKYELIITLGAPDLSALGDVFASNTDLFYRTPIINIDRQAGNERYGHVNYLDFTSSAVSETSLHLFRALGEQLLDAALSTTLLTGLIVATQSFTTASVTPETLRRAGDLVTRGAEREKIIQQLYRQRSVGTLKLWGAALSHLTVDRASGLVHTSLTRDDFARTGAAEHSLQPLVEELLTQTPEARRVLVLYEVPGDGERVRGIVATDSNSDARELAAAFEPQGTKHQATFIIEGKSLQAAEEIVLETIRLRGGTAGNK